MVLIKTVTLTGSTDELGSFAFSPDGRFIIITSEEGETFKVWDATSGKARFTFSGHTTPVTACAISPDGQWIVSASYDEPLKVWDAASGKNASLSLVIQRTSAQ